MLVNIRGAGANTTMLHSDIQMRLAVATNPSGETTGASAIFDRNINPNTVLGFNLATPRTNVDNGGRPNVITGVTLDVNSSSVVYDGSHAQGVINIHYYPSGKMTPRSSGRRNGRHQDLRSERRLHPSRYRHEPLTAMIPEKGG